MRMSSAKPPSPDPKTDKGRDGMVCLYPLCCVLSINYFTAMLMQKSVVLNFLNNLKSM